MPLATQEMRTSTTTRAQSWTRKGVLLGVAGVGLLGPLAMPGVASANVSTPVPAPSAVQSVTPAPAAAATPAPAATTSANTYTVKAGDTIARIAAAHGMRWDTLAELNGVKSPFVIYPNQVLKLSGTATAPAPVHTSRDTRPEPAAAPAVSGSGKGAQAVAYMMAQLQQGDRYAYGANGPSAWDCSSLTQAAWKSVGVSLPRTSAAQASAGTATTRAALVPGDLVRYPGHIAMYIGNGQVVHAVNANTGLKVTSVTWAGQPTGYRHIG